MNKLPQFFIRKESISDGEVLITGSDSHHLARVRRVKEGDRIMLRAEDGTGFIARVLDITPERVKASIVSELKRSGLIPEITLYMALLKSGNFEFVIQKTAEIGVQRIVPVVTERTIPDPDKMNDKKIDRWRKIAAEAAKQCLRTETFIVDTPCTLNEVLSNKTDDFKILCHPGAGIQLKESLDSREERERISILIGPEGGFSDREIAEATDIGWLAVNLGNTHLRAETAAIIIPSIVIYEWS